MGTVRRIAGWKGFRPFRFVRLTWWRALRRRGSPHQTALGMAIGLLIGISPAWGLHTWVALGVCFILPVNPIAVMLGTWCGNPLTFGPIVLGEVWLGDRLLSLTESDWTSVFEQVRNTKIENAAQAFELMKRVPKPLIYGSAVLGGLSAGIGYGLTYSYVLRRNMRRASRRAHARSRWRVDGPTEIVPRNADAEPDTGETPEIHP